jgi:hypothetical protein
LARRFGASEVTLYCWRDEFVTGGRSQLEGKGAESKLAREVDRLQREVESHQQVIGELTVANRIRPVPLRQAVRALARRP